MPEFLRSRERCASPNPGMMLAYYLSDVEKKLFFNQMKYLHRDTKLRNPCIGIQKAKSSGAKTAVVFKGSQMQKRPTDSPWEDRQVVFLFFF